MRRRVYLDHASTTHLDIRVFNAMRPFFVKKFGNSSSIYEEGVIAKKALSESRKKVALILQAHPDEIVFTSGGTESNNLAIFGVVRAMEKKGVEISKMHFITSVIEHSSVLECFRELESRGARVTYVKVQPNGMVNPDDVEKNLCESTVLVSIGYANNEIGTIQPIRKIANVIREHNSKFIIHNSQNGKKFRTFFHSDGSQAPLYLDMNVARLGVDLLTKDGHKMYGPKGVGALYVRRGTNISPIILGGGQEGGVRSTTENIPGIVGFATALEIADLRREKDVIRIAKLRDCLLSSILQNSKLNELTKIIVNGDMAERLPNNINISLPGIDTEMLVLKLDLAGFSCSTKSSCLRDEPGSYVVKALGGDAIRAGSTLRITLGRPTTKKDIDAFMKTLTKAIAFS